MAEKIQLSKSDRQKVWWRSQFLQGSWNYERMQGSSYLYMILPQLRKIYGDGTPELKEMMKTHTQFFNTSSCKSKFWSMVKVRA